MNPNKLMRNLRLFVAGMFAFIVFTPGPGLCAEPQKVAVFPFAMNSPQDLGFLQNGLFSMLSSRLADPGKVEVLDRESVDQYLDQAQTSEATKGEMNESKARIIGAAMGVDFVLFGSLTHFGESVSLDAGMVDVTGAKPSLTFFEQSNSMGDVIPLVNTFAGDVNQKVFNRSIANELYARQEPPEPTAPGGLEMPGMSGGGFANLQQTGGKGFSTHLKFEGEINAMAAGDVTQDGVVRVVAATDSELLIHKLDGNILALEKKLTFDSTNRIVGLDIADINKNGYPEIFVTSLDIHRTGLQSFVLEYNGSTYATLVDGQSYYYRVIDSQEGGAPLLLGQKTGAHPFHGDIYTMMASGKGYAIEKKLRMPRSASALSLAQGPVTSEDKAEYVLINEHGRLTVLSDTGSIDWEGNQKFGGTEHFFLLPRQDLDGSYREMVYLNPRIKFYDIGKDEKQEVLAIRNEEFGGGNLGRYKRFTRGSLEILAWNGIALTPMFKTNSVQGWISDFAIVDIDGDGADELLVSVVGKSKIVLLEKGRTSNIISYKLN